MHTLPSTNRCADAKLELNGAAPILMCNWASCSIMHCTPLTSCRMSFERFSVAPHKNDPQAQRGAFEFRGAAGGCTRACGGPGGSAAVGCWALMPPLVWGCGIRAPRSQRACGSGEMRQPPAPCQRHSDTALLAARCATAGVLDFLYCRQLHGCVAVGLTDSSACSG